MTVPQDLLGYLFGIYVDMLGKAAAKRANLAAPTEETLNTLRERASAKNFVIFASQFLSEIGVESVVRNASGFNVQLGNLTQVPLFGAAAAETPGTINTSGAVPITG